MNHWLILILSAIAMVAILVVFMWWWTTENWDWADATLKPPRPVPQEPLKAYLDWVDWREMTDGWMELQEDIHRTTSRLFQTMGQRVTALERAPKEQWQVIVSLQDRIAEAENVMNQIHKLEPPLPLAAIPSQVTDASITGANWDVAEQESIPPESLASSRSDQRIIVGGRVGRALKSAQETDVPT